MVGEEVGACVGNTVAFISGGSLGRREERKVGEGVLAVLGPPTASFGVSSCRF